MARIEKVLVVVSLMKMSSSTDSIVGRHQVSAQVAADGGVKISGILVNSASSPSLRLVRNGRQQKDIEVDADGNVEISDNFADSTRKLSPSFTRDAKQLNVMEIAADGTEASQDNFKHRAHIDHRGEILIHGLTEMFDLEPCNESACIRGDDCILVIDGLCRLANGSCGKDAECSQTSSGRAVQKNDETTHRDVDRVDEPWLHHRTRLEGLAQVSEMEERPDAVLKSIFESRDMRAAKSADFVSETPINQSIDFGRENALIDDALQVMAASLKPTQERNLGHNMSTWAIQNMTVVMSWNGSAELLRPVKQERLSKVDSFASQVASQAVLMFANFNDGVQMRFLSFQKIYGLSGICLGVALVLVSAICAIYWYSFTPSVPSVPSVFPGVTGNEVVVREMGALRTTILNALKVRKDADWLGTLSHYRKLRSDRVNQNHPLYGTLSGHFCDTSVQSEIHKLFSQLNGGRELITIEDIELMFSGFWIVAKNLDSGGAPVRRDFQTLEEYQWFVESINHPLPYQDFVTIFVFWLLYIMQSGPILFRKDASAQAQTGDSVDRFEFEYYVNVKGQLACHGRLTFGSFDRVGSRVFANRDVEERPFEYERS